MIDYEIRYVSKMVWKRHTHIHIYTRARGVLTAAECKTPLKIFKCILGLSLVFFFSHIMAIVRMLF